MWLSMRSEKIVYIYIYVIGNTILRLIIYKCRNIYNIAYIIRFIRNNTNKFRVVVGELEEKIVYIYIYW